MLSDQAYFALFLFALQIIFVCMVAIALAAVLGKMWQRFELTIGDIFKLQLLSGPNFMRRDRSDPAKIGHRLAIKGDQLYVWVWSDRDRGYQQLRIARMSALVSAETGEVIENKDIAAWMTKRGQLA
jgi:hypothetical protein